MKIGRNKFCKLVSIILTPLILIGCSSHVNLKKYASILDMTEQSNLHSQKPINYTVKSGDTLYEISRSIGISLDRLISANCIKNPDRIYPGQVINLSKFRNDNELRKKSLKNDTKNSESIRKLKIQSVSSIPNFLQKDNKKLESSEDRKRINAVIDDTRGINSINWNWPVFGKIVHHFDKNNKGIDIIGPIGTDIVAAADGTVIYSGNGVRGLGNLVILSHKNSFITAYAHNRKLFVEHGEEIRKGYKIAELGQSDTDYPCLHFEIRKQGIPVDPMKYLPKQKIR